MRLNREKIAEHFSQASKWVDGEIEAFNNRIEQYRVSRKRISSRFFKHSVFIASYFGIGLLIVIFRHAYFYLFSPEWLWVGQVSFYSYIFYVLLGFLISGEVLFHSKKQNQAISDLGLALLMSEHRHSQAKEAIEKFRGQLVACPETANQRHKLPPRLPEIEIQEGPPERNSEDSPTPGYILAGSSLLAVPLFAVHTMLTLALVCIAVPLTIELGSQSETLIWWWAGASGVIGAGLGGWFTLVKVLDDWGYGFDEDSFLSLITLSYALVVSLTLVLLLGVLVLLTRYVNYVLSLSPLDQVILGFVVPVLILLAVAGSMDEIRN